MLAVPGYRIDSKIYESVCSLIFRGIRESDQSPVIMKLLKESHPSPKDLNRYRREFDITGKLDMEGVARAYDLLKYGNSLIMVLEDFGAESLRDWIGHHETCIVELLELMVRITRILGQIHDQDIIHKDINPSNIAFNSRTGQLSIIDFGIASKLPKESPILTAPNVLEGTLCYMSPEQTGRMNRFLDYRTDYYSLGVTFYELLCKRLPFEAEDAMALIHAHLAREPEPPCDVNPAIPRSLSKIIMKLMAKTADARYRSSWGIEEDLKRCLDALKVNRSVPLFALGEKDFSDRFHIPQKLYGREQEVERLTAAFERVRRGRTEVMLVSGYAGIGKSYLVRELYRSITDSRGHFVSGKYDQFHRIPYSAISEAFRELILQIVAEGSQSQEMWRKRILNAVGNNGQVIIELVHELELIIGPQPPVPHLGGVEAANRFRHVFHSFLKTFCLPFHPLVLFVDDLQWADTMSLELLRQVVSDEDLSYLFLIGSYRDHEIDATHPLTRILNELKDTHSIVDYLKLERMSLSHVTTMIAETLQTEKKRVKSLARMVFQKTAGNPFFIGQFLETLHQENLLIFIPPSKETRPGWVWNLERIEAVGFTDNVVDLVISKLNKLPEVTREAVKLAACVGNRFDLETLAVIMEKSLWQAHEDLLPAVKEGFLLPDAELEGGNDQLNVCHFRFLHDRVQQAAYALIDPSQKERVHLNIGQMLVAKISVEEKEERLFELVDHLNVGRGLITEINQRRVLAEMNLAAGKKARQAAAYAAANDYLVVGMELMELWMDAPPEAVLVEFPDLALDFYRSRAETEYLNGDFPKAETFQQQALRLGRSPVEKAEIYHLLIVQHTVQARYQEALAVGREALKLLDIHLPHDQLEKAIFAGVMEVQEQLGEIPIQSLIHRDLMTDPEKKAAMLLLSTLFPTCYILDQNLFALLIVTAANLSLRFGHVPSSAMSYSVLGTLFGPLLGDYPSGHAFASLGVELADKLDDPIQKCQTRHVMIAFNSHWTQPLRESLPIADVGLQAGRECGDMQFASYILFFKALNLFVGGNNLESSHNDLVGFLSFCERTRNRIAIDMVLGCQMVVANLLGRTSGIDNFGVEHMSEARFLEDCKALLSRQPLCSYYILKAQVCYLYGRYDQALELIHEARVLLPCILGFITVAEHNFYHSLILIALIKNASAGERRKHLATIARNQKQMEIWMSHCPENFKHKYLLVEAERCRLGKRINKAMDLYDCAIQAANDEDFIQDQALAAELAGRFWLERGKSRIGEAYLKDAHHAYRIWGAQAKVAQLITQFPQWLTQNRRRGSDHSSTDLSRTTISGETSSRALDLGTVLKASRAISGEIVLEELLRKLMAILIENAGAQKGLLLLEKMGEWLICARSGLQQKETVLEQEALSKSRDLSPAIVHYVIKTGEAVLLGDASSKGRFTSDPYVRRVKPKSILCTPILNQARLTGVLYLENNLVNDAFTQDLLELLQLLSAQAAVSIVNAGLYSNLEKKVRERTRELQVALQQLEQQHSQLKKTKDQLVESEKMAALGTLTAGVAHEIRNPLNFINNFAAISVELFNELDQILADLGQQPNAECFELTNDLKLNVASIHKHGLTADQIIKSMMELTDGSAYDVRMVEFNHFVDEYVELAFMGKRGPDGSLGITLNKKYDPETGFLNAAPKSLSRAWIHLMNNAVESLMEKSQKVGSDYHGAILIQTRNLGDQVELTIRDNGMGIKAGDRDEIFHPFFTTKPPGTGHIGLGLARCYDIIVREHGGRIEVNSKEGEYTEVVAVLPKSQEH